MFLFLGHYLRNSICTLANVKAFEVGYTSIHAYINIYARVLKPSGMCVCCAFVKFIVSTMRTLLTLAAIQTDRVRK